MYIVLYLEHCDHALFSVYLLSQYNEVADGNHTAQTKLKYTVEGSLQQFIPQKLVGSNFIQIIKTDQNLNPFLFVSVLVFNEKRVKAILCT